jgi:hypothetical protein
MGQSGGLAMLFLLFLAVTSAVSTEQVAVSNILTYDIYATYINKNPTEKQILWISRVTIASYCVVMGGIATAFNYIGISMGYLYVLMVSGPWGGREQTAVNSTDTSGLHHRLCGRTHRLLYHLASRQRYWGSRRRHRRFLRRHRRMDRDYFGTQ